VGRPRLIASPEDFNERAERYFEERADKPITVTGLALAVGLSSRESLDEYGRREEYSDCVKRAKARVQDAYEGRLWSNAPAGAIFALKNMGWSDKQELAHSGELGIRRIERVIRHPVD
jgi:hypothetical protein